MREINVNEIKDAVKNLCIDANYYLPDDVFKRIEEAIEEEESEVGKNILKTIRENAIIAREKQIPICQDTGLAVIFLEIGQEVHFTGGNLYNAINEGVSEGYKEGYLRKSTCHPFTRKNLGDNTPAIIHTKIVDGDKVKIRIAPKGGGSENMSLVKMLKPADGIEGVKKLVIQRVSEAGPNPCPPIIVGVGIGGNFERCAILAKEALLRKIGSRNPDPELDKLEKELLVEINKLGIGPQGLGGRITALAVFVKMEPCHIASLPVGINIQCHAARHKEVVI